MSITSLDQIYEFVSVRRADPTTGELTDIVGLADDIEMLIVPKRSFDDPTRLDRQQHRPRYDADVKIPNKLIQEEDIIIRGPGRNDKDSTGRYKGEQLIVANKLELGPVQQLELERHRDQN